MGLTWSFTCGQGNIDNENAVVIYLDTDEGESGFGDTVGFTDTGGGSDFLRAATSGQAAAGEGRADLIFAPTFRANFALAFNRGVAVLYELRAGGEGHRYVATVSGSDFGTDSPYQFQVSYPQLGITAGSSVRFFVTYLDAVSAYRSNEFIGVAASSVPKHNIENQQLSLKAGDFVVLRTTAEPQ